MSACPRCSANLTVNDFRCPRCRFQILEPCPSCHHEIAIEAYVSVKPNLWQCPQCNSKIYAAYADPMTTDEGEFVEPLVHLKIASAGQAA